MTRDAWTALDSDARYRAFVAATACQSAPGTQFSHDSAAALWRLPTIGAWSPRAHVLGPIARGGRSSAGVKRHGIGLDEDAEKIDGVTVTSLARTVLDVAMSGPFMRAVCMADDALRDPEKGDFRFGRVAPARSELQYVLRARSHHRGAVRAGKVFEFADGLSESAGESVSRVQFHALGFPAPELQVPFHDERGYIGAVDFFWRHLGLVGEFDGHVKYRNAVYLRGRLPEEVVIAEKEREDRIRRVTKGFVRWDWRIAMDRAALAERVRPFGLVP